MAFRFAFCFVDWLRHPWCLIRPWICKMLPPHTHICIEIFSFFFFELPRSEQNVKKIYDSFDWVLLVGTRTEAVLTCTSRLFSLTHLAIFWLHPNRFKIFWIQNLWCFDALRLETIFTDYTNVNAGNGTRERKKKRSMNIEQLPLVTCQTSNASKRTNKNYCRKISDDVRTLYTAQPW